jgi:hypothetical protein
VQLDLAPAELRRRFPAFPGASAALEVVLRAGDMLFLPAGWFHEVTSFGEPGACVCCVVVVAVVVVVVWQTCGRGQPTRAAWVGLGEARRVRRVV